jgi:hypothetical protein
MRYYLFAGESYYPEGGVEDFKMSGTYDECLKWLSEPRTHDWWHIADENMTQIAHNGMDMVAIAGADRMHQYYGER